MRQWKPTTWLTLSWVSSSMIVGHWIKKKNKRETPNQICRQQNRAWNSSSTCNMFYGFIIFISKSTYVREDQNSESELRGERSLFQRFFFSSFSVFRKFSLRVPASFVGISDEVELEWRSFWVFRGLSLCSTVYFDFNGGSLLFFFFIFFSLVLCACVLTSFLSHFHSPSVCSMFKDCFRTELKLIPACSDLSVIFWTIFRLKWK